MTQKVKLTSSHKYDTYQAGDVGIVQGYVCNSAYTTDSAVRAVVLLTEPKSKSRQNTFIETPLSNITAI